VRRISVGGSLARVAQASFAAAAQEIADDGTFTRFANLPNNAAVNAVFGR
jgi:methylisocitrate lyase